MKGRYPESFHWRTALGADGLQGRATRSCLLAPLELGRLSLLHESPRRLRCQPGDLCRVAAHFSWYRDRKQLAWRARSLYPLPRRECPPKARLQNLVLKYGRNGIYDLVTRITKEYDHPIIEITESGCGYLDSPNEQGRVPDLRRIQWYREHLAELARAISDGSRVRAYHAWTLLDNFQWAEGYTERYGLIYTDFRSQKRTVKDSGLWYGRVAGSGRLVL